MPVAVTISPIRDPAGNVIGASKIVVDITERKRAENAMRLSERKIIESQRFLQSTLDALSSHIAILDETGVILAVNAKWNRFAADNQASISGLNEGGNYLEVCDRSRGDCAEEAPAVARGIRTVIAGDREEFQLEYPCHSPNKKRWFIVRVTRFEVASAYRIVIAHENITERKMAEIKLATTQNELVVASRRAGMAEIATGVLHNVGNVLNSVNVSASLVQEKIERLRIANLSKTVVMLKERESDLPAF